MRLTEFKKLKNLNKQIKSNKKIKKYYNKIDGKLSNKRKTWKNNKIKCIWKSKNSLMMNNKSILIKYNTLMYKVENKTHLKVKTVQSNLNLPQSSKKIYKKP